MKIVIEKTSTDTKMEMQGASREMMDALADALWKVMDLSRRSGASDANLIWSGVKILESAVRRSKTDSVEGICIAFGERTENSL